MFPGHNTYWNDPSLKSIHNPNLFFFFRKKGPMFPSPIQSGEHRDYQDLTSCSQHMLEHRLYIKMVLSCVRKPIVADF